MALGQTFALLDRSPYAGLPSVGLDRSACDPGAKGCAKGVDPAPPAKAAHM